MTIQKDLDLSGLTHGTTVTTGNVGCDSVDQSGTAVGDVPPTGVGILDGPAIKFTDRRSCAISTSVTTWSTDEWAAFSFRRAAPPTMDIAISRFNSAIDGSEQAGLHIEATTGKIVTHSNPAVGEKSITNVCDGNDYLIVHHIDQDGLFHECFIFDAAFIPVEPSFQGECKDDPIVEWRWGQMNSLVTGVCFIGPVKLADEPLAPEPPTEGIIAEYEHIGTLGDPADDATEGADSLNGSGTMILATDMPHVGDLCVTITGESALRKVPSGASFGPRLWTVSPWKMVSLPDACDVIMLRSAVGIVGGVTFSPDGKVRLKVEGGFVDVYEKSLLDNPGFWIKHWIDQTLTPPQQYAQLTSRRGKVLALLQGECTADPVIRHDWGVDDGPADSVVIGGVAQFADIPIVPPGLDFVSGYVLNGVKDHNVAAVTAQLTDGVEARLVVPDGYTVSPEVATLTGDRYCRFEVTRTTGTDDLVEWSLEARASVLDEFEEIEAGSFQYYGQPGTTGTDIYGFIGCGADSYRGKDPYPRLQSLPVRTWVWTGDRGYANRGDDLVAATCTFTDFVDQVATPGAHGLAIGDLVKFKTITTTTGISPNVWYYVKTTPSGSTFTLAATLGGATINLVTNGTGTNVLTPDGHTVADDLADEQQVTDEFPNEYELMRVHDMKRSRSDHDGGGGSNMYWAGPARLLWDEAYRIRYPHWTPVALPAGCNFESWVDHRTCFIKVDTRSAQASNPLMADGPSKTLLGAAQKAQVLALLNSPPTGVVGFVFITDMGWLGDSTIGTVGGKVDAWGNYATERAEIGAAMSIRRGTIQDGDWHHGHYDDGTGSVGGWPVIGMASIIRNTGNIKIFFDHLPASTELWPPWDGIGTFPEQPLAIYSVLQIIDAGNTYTHILGGFDASATIDSGPVLGGTFMWSDVPAPLVDRRVIIGGLDASKLNVHVSNRDAFWIVPPLRGENLVIPTRPGREWVPGKVHDQSVLPLEFSTWGRDEDGVYSADRIGKNLENLQLITRRLRSYDLLELLVYEGSDAWRFWVELSSGLSISADPASSSDVARFLADLDVPSGVCQSQYPFSQTLPIDSLTDNYVFDLSAGASAPLWTPVVTVEGRVTNGYFKDGNGESWLRYEEEVGPRETLVLDGVNDIVLKDGVDVEKDVAEPGNGPLLTLYPRWPDGAYVIRVEADVIGSGATITLDGYINRHVA